MARFYNMEIDVSGFRKGKRKSIHEAVEKEWPIDSFDFHDQSALFGGEGNLCGGESEEEFARRITYAVWKTNGAYCEVNVKATYLEELPFETYSFGEKDYQRFRKGIKLGRSKTGR